MIHRLFTSCSCVGASRASVRCFRTDQSQFGVTALVALVELQAPVVAKEPGACGCNASALIPTPSPSSSCALGVNSLPSASSSRLPVHRSLGGNRLIVRTSPLHWRCQQVLCSIRPSVPSTFLVQIVNPEDPDDGWMAAEAPAAFAH